MKIDSNLIKSREEVYASKLDDIDYEIAFSNHIYKERYIPGENKYQNRLLKNFNMKRLNHLVRPYIKKMMKDSGKYLLIMQKEEGSDKKVYVLVAVEPHRKIENAWFVLLITTVEDNTERVTFKKIPAKRRIFVNMPYSDLFRHKELMTEDELSEYKRELLKKEREKNKKFQTGIKIVRKKS